MTSPAEENALAEDEPWGPQPMPEGGTDMGRHSKKKQRAGFWIPAATRSVHDVVELPEEDQDQRLGGPNADQPPVSESVKGSGGGEG
jgi:hypothetical protein